MMKELVRDAESFQLLKELKQLRQQSAPSVQEAMAQRVAKLESQLQWASLSAQPLLTVHVV